MADKKTEFVLRLFREYGFLVWFEGRAPDYLSDSSDAPKRERFGPWCRRVLGRDADAVDVLVVGAAIGAGTLVSNLADEDIATTFKALLKERRDAGRRSEGEARAAAEEKLTLAKQEIRKLKADNARLEAEKSQLSNLNREKRSAARGAFDRGLRAHLDAELDEFTLNRTATMDAIAVQSLKAFTKGLSEGESFLTAFESLMKLVTHSRGEVVRADARIADLNRQLVEALSRRD